MYNKFIPTISIKNKVFLRGLGSADQNQGVWLVSCKPGCCHMTVTLVNCDCHVIKLWHSYCIIKESLIKESLFLSPI